MHFVEHEVYQVGVHIADVSYFVERDSSLDNMAAERATTVYLVDRVCLPPAHSSLHSQFACCLPKVPIFTLNIFLHFHFSISIFLFPFFFLHLIDLESDINNIISLLEYSFAFPIVGFRCI